MSGTRTPDYRVKAMDKSSDKLKGQVGAAWLNEDGRISVVLDPFIMLRQDGDLVVTLFPIKKAVP